MQEVKFDARTADPIERLLDKKRICDLTALRRPYDIPYIHDCVYGALTKDQVFTEEDYLQCVLDSVVVLKKDFLQELTSHKFSTREYISYEARAVNLFLCAMCKDATLVSRRLERISGWRGKAMRTRKYKKVRVGEARAVHKIPSHVFTKIYPTVRACVEAYFRAHVESAPEVKPEVPEQPKAADSFTMTHSAVTALVKLQNATIHQQRETIDEQQKRLEALQEQIRLLNEQLSTRTARIEELEQALDSTLVRDEFMDMVKTAVDAKKEAVVALDELRT